MTSERNGEQQTLDWQETTWDGQDHTEVHGRKQTHAAVRTRWTGPLEADSEQHWLMTYRSDEHAEFVGLEHVTGTLDGRPGAFVLAHRGTFQNASVRSEWTVVEGSGEGELVGLRGEGTLVFASEEGEHTRWTFAYDLDGGVA